MNKNDLPECPMQGWREEVEADKPPVVIVVKRKLVCNRVKYYPICDLSRLLCAINGLKCVSEDQLKRAREFDISVEILDVEKT